MALRRFFNTSGVKYRKLHLKDKLPELSAQEQYRLLAGDGMLIKRPLLIGPDWATTGFETKEWARLLRLDPDASDADKT